METVVNGFKCRQHPTPCRRCRRESSFAYAKVFEMLKDEDLREHHRTYKVWRKIAVHNLASVLEQLKTWEEQTRSAVQKISMQERSVKIFANLLLGKDGGFRQDQVRKWE